MQLPKFMKSSFRSGAVVVPLIFTVAGAALVGGAALSQTGAQPKRIDSVTLAPNQQRAVQWNEETVKQRYDWIFQYDATRVAV